MSGPTHSLEEARMARARSIAGPLMVLLSFLLHKNNPRAGGTSEIAVH